MQLPLPLEGATIEIRTTNGVVTTIDARDADLAEHNWFAASWHNKQRQYVFCSQLLNGKRSAPMHRIILSRMLGRELGSKEQVDHIDNNPLNNTRANLRLATTAENTRNGKRRSTNRSGYKGVGWDRTASKWRAYIKVDGKYIHLGVFDDPREAHRAYCEAAVKHFGDFARFE